MEPTLTERDDVFRKSPKISTRIVFTVWLLDSILLAFLFGHIWLYGNDSVSRTWARDLGAVWGVATAFLIAPMWKAMKQWPAPYRTFVYSLVCFTGVAVGAVFVLVSASAQGSPNAFAPPNATYVIGLFGTALWVSRSWFAIAQAEPENNPEFRRKHRVFGMKAGAIIVGVLICVGVAVDFLVFVPPREQSSS